MSWEDIKVDLVIREASLACPEVVGSNPAPATKYNRRSEDVFSDLLFYCLGEEVVVATTIIRSVERLFLSRDEIFN